MMRIGAKKLKIPVWLVHLRHRATHWTTPPSLKSLRQGCEAALEWLKEEHWAKYKETDLKRQEGGMLKRIKKSALQSRNQLIDVLLGDGFLVPTVGQLEEFGCDTSYCASLTEPRLPKTFLRFWLPLLKMVSSPAFIQVFLEKLFAKQKLLTKEPKGHRAFYIAAWISEVLLCNRKKGARRKHRIFRNRIQLKGLDLISLCLDAPSISMPHLLQLILDDMEH
ncbi:ribosomal biogenesis protein LAS1L-like [Pelmatolapia mariae]|uniref:ribosomal biogenesis protein LAS1L-like n=1 Tax=Pelmatolapia mariae TaxID=158779 RepID=UPI002FE531F2